ncbi:response regulator [Polynucleobacter sp. SHI2]|uniref:response regulator n=1 Tax=Polynucleobacter sp. SHI2 TaxID=926417 RepID=UPI00249331E7|nr:response regulator [Polynucleobacter sp. SHI2]
MRYANELFFLVSALTLWGLVFASSSLIKLEEKGKSDAYWFWALVFLASAYSFFAIASSTFIVLITLANACFVASHLYFAFYTSSLLNPAIRKWRYLPLLGILFFGIVFEILRQNGTFVQRVSLVVVMSILCMIWTSLSLILFGVKKSNQLKLLLISTFAEIIFASARLILLFVDPPELHINLYQEPFLSTLFRLCWFSFQSLSYINIIGYFIEKSSLERANVEIVNKAKGQFLANISHEIRTPLHGLIGLVSMVLKSSLSEEVRKSLDKVLYSSKALLVILNDILDFSKIEAGVIEIRNEPFKMKSLLDDTHDLFSIPAAEKGIELRFDIDPATPEVMVGDFYKLRQVLFNLVGNSIKFTHQGYVEVKVRIDQIEAETVRLTMTIKDTGFGISEKDLKAIFEPFNQLDNTNSRQYDGVGLGLPITQSILLKMGTELVMKSQPGVGTESTFAIRLGINHDAPNQHFTLQSTNPVTEVSVPYKSLAGLHVLVAEDNPINIEVVRHYLNFLKIKYHIVMDGQQCLEALKNNRYDGVLMDIQMPNLDGIQATYRIRLIKELKDIPIIGLSAGVAKSDREKGLQSGMNDFLVKPFDVEELAKTLMKYLCVYQSPTNSNPNPQKPIN